MWLRRRIWCLYCESRGIASVTSTSYSNLLLLHVRARSFDRRLGSSAVICCDCWVIAVACLIISCDLLRINLLRHHNPCLHRLDWRTYIVHHFFHLGCLGLASQSCVVVGALWVHFVVMYVHFEDLFDFEIIFWSRLVWWVRFIDWAPVGMNLWCGTSAWLLFLFLGTGRLVLNAEILGYLLDVVVELRVLLRQVTRLDSVYFPLAYITWALCDCSVALRQNVHAWIIYNLGHVLHAVVDSLGLVWDCALAFLKFTTTRCCFFTLCLLKWTVKACLRTFEGSSDSMLAIYCNSAADARVVSWFIEFVFTLASLWRIQKVVLLYFWVRALYWNVAFRGRLA